MPRPVLLAPHPRWTTADANRLRAWRLLRHLSVVELANCLGAGPVELAAWEAGRRAPPYVAMLWLALEQLGPPVLLAVGVGWRA